MVNINQKNRSLRTSASESCENIKNKKNKRNSTNSITREMFSDAADDTQRVRINLGGTPCSTAGRDTAVKRNYQNIVLHALLLL